MSVTPSDFAWMLQLVTGLAMGLSLVPASFAGVHFVERWLGSAQRRVERHLDADALSFRIPLTHIVVLGHAVRNELGRPLPRRSARLPRTLEEMLANTKTATEMDQEDTDGNDTDAWSDDEDDE